MDRKRLLRHGEACQTSRIRMKNSLEKEGLLSGGRCDRLLSAGQSKSDHRPGFGKTKSLRGGEIQSR